MFQSLFSPIRSRFDTSKGQPTSSSDQNDPTQSFTSPGELSLLSPRSPLAWGVPSPALSVFGGQPCGNITSSSSGRNDPEDMANAEEFARDVLVELMRGALEELRLRAVGDGVGLNHGDILAQVKILSEIHRIMQQDAASLNSLPSMPAINKAGLDEPRTKAVFRELDGFICLMSVLSAISLDASNTNSSGNVVVSSHSPLFSPQNTRNQTDSDLMEECLRLVFLVLGEALDDSTTSEVYFRTKVGWESLFGAINSLLSSSLRNHRPRMLSHILSLALNDFHKPLDAYFIFDEAGGLASVDERASQIKSWAENEGETTLRMKIKHPSAIHIMWNLCHGDEHSQTRYALFKVIEVLFGACHRNASVLASLAIVGDVFKRFQDVGISLKSMKTDSNALDPEDEKTDLEKEKLVLQRLLRKLLEMGANTTDSRRIFQAAIVRTDGVEKVDAEILEVIRLGMRSRWVEHFSLEGRAAIHISDENKWRTLPKEGLSFMMWIYLSTLPTGESAYSLFSAESTVASPAVMLGPQQTIIHFQLLLLAEGMLKFCSNAADSEVLFVTFPNSKIRRGRWTHLTLVWYPRTGSHPNLRLYLDGSFIEGLHLAYPKTEALLGAIPFIEYKIGDQSTYSENNRNGISWCLASAYLLGLPLLTDIPRLIHHLGPRYIGSFQDPRLVRFLTYEAATSLNMYIANCSTLRQSMSPTQSPTSGPGVAPSFTSSLLNTRQVQPNGLNSILKALREGMSSVGVREETIMFGISPADFEWGVNSRKSFSTTAIRSRRRLSDSWSGGDTAKHYGQNTVLLGDVFVVKVESLDTALWKMGGAAVSLALVDLAETPHELSRTIAILTDSLKNNWQNSEDMERMRGYDILAAILRRKAHLINLTAFETLFEFLGLNFSVPEQSTIVNPLAYKAIALDFSLWAKAGTANTQVKSTTYKKQIQHAHLDHFTTLLATSRFRAFNWAVGLGEVPSSSKKDQDKGRTRKGQGRNVGLVRRMLFALQMGWYGGLARLPNDSDWPEENEDTTQRFFEALGSALRAGFGRDDIKAVVAYLAANLHHVDPVMHAAVDGTKTSNGDNLRVPHDGIHIEGDGATTPQSATSHFSFTSLIGKSAVVPSSRNNAEKLFELLVDILSSTLADPSVHVNQTHYHKFTTALPLTRILLLLLGDRPTPHTAALVLRLIAVAVAQAPSFNRKFELVGGWNTLRIVLSSPSVWNDEVDRAALHLLLGMSDNRANTRNFREATAPGGTPRKEGQQPKYTDAEVSCPHILPTIMSALKAGLVEVAGRCRISDEDGAALWTTENGMEHLIEEMLTLHSSSATFRQAFESHQITQLFIDAYKAVLEKLKETLANSHCTTEEGENGNYVNGWNLRILEKMSHLGLALALDNAVGGPQKQEILDKIQSAETIINPGSATTCIDPGLVADSRSVRQRIASARFNIQVGERPVMKTMARVEEWRKTIKDSEKKRLRKMILDFREFRRQVSRLTEWRNLVISGRGLWPRHDDCVWRLDETEGPHRVRKKLESHIDNSPSFRVDSLGELIRDVYPPPPEAETSAMQIEVPPWAESYEISATEVADQQLIEEVIDDKLRRVRHELEVGDVIEAVASVARIDGVDAYPGLLIFGRTHIYMLDGVIENDEGEVIDAQDAPKTLFFIPGSIIELNGPQKARRWPHSQIATCANKKFLFRDVALELYFKDSRSLLVVFLDKTKRTDLEARLLTVMGRSKSDLSLAKMGTRMLAGFRSDELSTATRKWQSREMSNFAYLSILNQISGRTPSDATQYPVFPWVLNDYNSQILDLNDPASFRDLTKPMGALTTARRQAAETRYTNLQDVGEEPFHYGTHFSSSMIVCHFLIRLAPFTNMFKTLQGGDWDLPDRLFSDLGRAYESAAHDVRGDVRELIPEFFTCPEFLENSANHDFGVLQQTGERIHDVKLPPWARRDPLLFIVLNRRALENPIVSEQLPAWIDLIWGCKQRDSSSLNVFHPLSYEGSINLNDIKDDLERDATVGIIHNFGQTPRKLFNSPHPEREKHGLHTLPVGTLHGVEEDPHLLSQNSRCFKDLGPANPVRALVLDPTSDKVIPCPEGVLCLPRYPHEHVEWRQGSTELRVVVDAKVVQVIENTFCTCSAFADMSCLVTGSSDYTVRLWKVSRGQQGSGSTSASGIGGTTGMRLVLSHIMRVHTNEVVCVAASRPWSLVVSGSKDGSAALWDLNRGIYVRSIWHRDGGEDGMPMAVDLVAVNESTGYIATCSRLKLCLHTINARPIATLDLTTTPSFSSIVPTITAMAFHEREYSHLGVLATAGPDGSITLRTWTADGTPEGEKAQWEFLTIRTMKARISGSRPPAITALRFVEENLYHGEETGKSYIWNLPST